MKKLLAVLLSVLMIASSTVAVFSLSVGEEITSGVPQLSIINPATSSWLNQAKKIVANDKYIFVGASLCGGRAYAILKAFFEKCAEMLGGTSENLFSTPIYQVSHNQFSSTVSGNK